MVQIDEWFGEEYRGDAPYAIVSLDGRKRDDLQSFAPTVASAAILEKFYGGEDTGGQVIGALETAMELYSDFTYHQKAQRLKEQLEALDPESESFEKDQARLEKLFSAYAGNIRQELFKVAGVDE